MNLLALLPLNETKLKVMLEIYSEEDYLRSLEKKTGVNPSLLYRVLKSFTEAGLVKKVSKGREFFYSLTSESQKLFLPLLEKYQLDKVVEKNELVKILLKLILNNPQLQACQKIFLSGPGVLGAGKRVDILFVTKEGQGLARWCREAALVIGKEINPSIYTLEKFKLELGKKESQLNSIIQDIKNRVVVK